MNSFQNHFTPDIGEQKKSDPGDKRLKGSKGFCKKADTSPPDHRHEKLKESECACNQAHSSAFHKRVMEPVCNGNRKGIHGKSESEQNTVDKKAPGHSKTDPSLQFHGKLHCSGGKIGRNGCQASGDQRHHWRKVADINVKQNGNLVYLQ